MSTVVEPNPDHKTENGPADQEQSAPATAPLVLIVEDEAMIRDIIVHVLQRVGYRVLTATDGRRAVQSLNIPGIKLIITDLCMPNMDGVELVMELRKHAREIPIIAISGALSGKSGDLLRTAQLLGAKMTMAKPFSMTELITAVHQFAGPPTPAVAQNGS